MGETELSLDNFYFFEVLTLVQSAQESDLSLLYGDVVPTAKVKKLYEIKSPLGACLVVAVQESFQGKIAKTLEPFVIKRSALQF